MPSIPSDICKKAPNFDLLFWNSDATRMPEAMHSYYLRNMYIENNLVRPNALEIEGTKLDLGKIRNDIYCVATVEDHIAPWKSVYRLTQLAGGASAFRLGASGHIAGIVNPPDGQKARYWSKPQAKKGENADVWLSTATRHDGSWWQEWMAWAQQRSGPKRPAWKLPDGEPAPGKYVVDQTGPTFDLPSRPQRRSSARRCARPNWRPSAMRQKSR